MVSLAPLTYLRLHDVVEYEHRLCRVALVNECRARLVPIKRRTVTLVPKTGGHAGKPVAFTAQDDGVSISPGSQLSILGRWDPAAQTVRFAGRAAPPTPPEPEPSTPVPVPNQLDLL